MIYDAILSIRIKRLSLMIIFIDMIVSDSPIRKQIFQ